MSALLGHHIGPTESCLLSSHCSPPQVSDYRQQLEDMKAEGERRSCDLSHVRESLHSSTEEAALLRKQIEVRGQELAAAKREASNILR